MARVRMCISCRKPERECECPLEDDPSPEPGGEDEPEAA